MLLICCRRPILFTATSWATITPNPIDFELRKLVAVLFSVVKKAAVARNPFDFKQHNE